MTPNKSITWPESSVLIRILLGAPLTLVVDHYPKMIRCNLLAGRKFCHSLRILGGELTNIKTPKVSHGLPWRPQGVASKHRARSNPCNVAHKPPSTGRRISQGISVYSMKWTLLYLSLDFMIYLKLPVGKMVFTRWFLSNNSTWQGSRVAWCRVNANKPELA